MFRIGFGPLFCPRHLNAIFRDHISRGRLDSRGEPTSAELVGMGAPLDSRTRKAPAWRRPDVRWRNTAFGKGSRSPDLGCPARASAQVPVMRSGWSGESTIFAARHSCQVMDMWLAESPAATVELIAAKVRELHAQWSAMSDGERFAGLVGSTLNNPPPPLHIPLPAPH